MPLRQLLRDPLTLGFVVGVPAVQLLLFGWTLAFFYHFLNGIRHLIWDTGRALDVETSEKMGIAMFAGAFVLTFVTVLLV